MGMEASLAERVVATDGSNQVQAMAVRSLVSEIRGDYARRAVAAEGPAAVSAESQVCEEIHSVGPSAARCPKAMEGKGVHPIANAGPLDQKAQHDDSQLEKEGIRTVNVASLYELLLKQEHCCALSGRQLTPNNVILDHIDPFANSNDHSLDNVQLVVYEANRAKGCMANQDFIQLCRDVAARHPLPPPVQGS